MKKIEVYLIGGLGNQLFQYATSKALAKREKRDLVLNTLFLKENPSKGRIYSLNNLSINSEIINKNKLYELIKYIFRRFIIKSIIKEKKFEYHDIKLNKGSSIQLLGYWQSWKYFDELRDELINEIYCPNKLNKTNQNIYLEIIKNNSVCLHIRRGDYLSNLKANETHGVCSAEYFFRGIDFIAKKIESCKFYIFSDDIEWAKSTFTKNENFFFVDNNKLNPHYDLWLMISCKHFILSNSTFGWWAAWLSNHDKKIVIIPSKWFKSDLLSDVDLLPSQWTRL